MEVKIYSAPGCVYCQMAKAYFSEKGIDYIEVDVSENESERQQMFSKTGQGGVPVIEINGQIIVGFNRPEIEKIIGNSK